LATADDRVDVDALLVSRKHGVAAFVLADRAPTNKGEWDEVIDQQDRLYTVLESHLGEP